MPATDGTFIVKLAQPLHAGQRIYFTDGCTDPPLAGPAVFIASQASAPVLSFPVTVALGVMLGLFGFLALRRVRRSA